ncbi:MAG TPA: hypothetical protein VGB22_02210 [candidate division Zixibacteria bacterium]
MEIKTSGFEFADPAIVSRGGLSRINQTAGIAGALGPSHSLGYSGVAQEEVVAGYAKSWLDDDSAGARIATMESFVITGVHQGDHQLTIELVDVEGLPLEPAIRKSVTFRSSNLLAHIEQNTFATSCAITSCHGNARIANLHLDDGEAYAQLVMVEPENAAARDNGMKRVVPGDSEASFLWMKINGPSSEYGSRMPPTGPALTAIHKTWIGNWIDQGALPNDY